jgi:hypothetical protein
MVSPYKDYNSVFRWQANIFVHMTTELLHRRYDVVFGGLTYFVVDDITCCLWSCRTISPCGCLLCCLWNFWLFVSTVRTLSGYENTNGP